jgi:carbon monoxide dehydrogenase subunit G
VSGKLDEKNGTTKLKIEKSVEVKASLDNIWEAIESPEKAAKASSQDVELKQKSDDQYELKVPLKLGLLKIKIACEINFIERRPKSYTELEFKANVPGGNVDGQAKVTLKPKSDNITIVDIVADVNSGGVVSSMLGGEEATGKRLDGIFEKIANSVGQAAE